MRRFGLLVLLTAIAFALRVHRLGHQELRGDEGFTWNYIQKSPPEIVATIIREGDPQPPLHYWLQWAWAQFTGDTEFAMRAWSACLSLLLVPLMYHVGRKLWRPEVGWLAAGLTAIHPQQIWLAQDVRNMYQLALIALLLATLSLPRLLTPGSDRWRPWLAYVACGTLAMYSHYYALFFLIGHGAYLLASPGASLGQPGKRLGRAARPSWSGTRVPGIKGRFAPGRAGIGWLTAGGAIAALVAPWAVVILPVYARGQLADPGSLSLPDYTVAALGDLTAGPVFPTPIKLIFIAAFAVLAVIAFWVQRVDFKPAQAPYLPVYLFTCLIVPYAGIYAITRTRSTFNSFYFVFAFPAAYLLAAGGVYVLYKKLRPLGLSVLCAGLLGYGFGLGNYYFNPDYGKTRGMRDVAARLSEAAQPGDVYLANFPDPAQVYYVHRLNLNYHMEPGRPGFDPAQVDIGLGQLTAGRVWFVPVQSILDPEQYVLNRLSRTAILAEDHRFYKMRLMLFLPPSAAHPLEANFADGIRLVGYYLTPNRLSLIWTADAQPSANYTVFVHALAADTFNLNGHDASPPLPTSQWQPGQPVVDVHEFEIPTGQAVTLVAGMYQPATGDRLRLESDSFGEPQAARVTTLTP